MTFHLIANAHLDPVWLWDWREGLNEGISTCRAVLDMMDEDPELTFIRGESAVYEHIERNDPQTFRRILDRVAEGRWDPVGGTVVQSDTNLTSTETLLHSFLQGQDYFRTRFGRTARVAWFADSFGHSGGLPEIFAAAGIQSFVFTRPGPEILSLPKPAFHWLGDGGARILAYRPPVGWYGAERDAMPATLDALLSAARSTDLENVGVLYGLGNHGGGPSRRQVEDIRSWARSHPELEARFSTLHGFMDALREETEAKGDGSLPTHRGELGYCMRGCYASLARLKYTYRRAEAAVNRAERTAAAVSGAGCLVASGPTIRNARAGVVFNSFHDILPGSVMERAAEEQLYWLGGALHRAQRVENEALLALARRIDTTVPLPVGDSPSAVPVLLWNPHPVDVVGAVEMEAALDARPLWAYRGRVSELPLELLDADGKPMPFQVVANEGPAMADMAWRVRVIARTTVPATGWRVLTLGCREGASVARARRSRSGAATSPAPGRITNGLFQVSARTGGRGVRILRAGKPFLGEAGLGAVTVSDPWGSWGGMREEPESRDLSEVIHTWRVTASKVLEQGDERATLWVRMEGGRSRMDMRISLYRGREAVDVAVRLLWDERSARLKLVLPCGARDAVFQVPGGTARRGAVGEVPGGRWVRVRTPARHGLGFASDSLYGFDLKRGSLRVTVARATRYACDRALGPDEEPWTPAADRGELKLRFLLGPGDERLALASALLEEPVVATPVPATPGDLARVGSLLRVEPEAVGVVALRPAVQGEDMILTLQSRASRPVTVRVVWQESGVELGTLAPWVIRAWRLVRQDAGWAAEPVSALT